MRSLHNVKAGRNRLIRFATIAGLIISILFALKVDGKTVYDATAKSIQIKTQNAVFAYWSVDEGFNSSVILNNAENSQLIVRPTLYNLDGQSLSVNPIVLEARQQRIANIADWIRESGGSELFKCGSLIIAYDASDPASLGAQISITNSALSLSFDVPPENPAAFASSQLEGLWWRRNDGSQYNLVLSNTTDSRVEKEASFTGDQRAASPYLLKLNLGPHQTEIINIGDLKLPFSTGKGAGKMGGISITHSGEPGAALAYGMLAGKKDGFSLQFPFEDVASRRSETLAAAHLMIDEPDLPGFSPQTSFTSMALLRNASNDMIEVRPKVSFTSNGSAQTVALPARHLLPQQVEAIEIGAELKRTGIQNAVEGAGLTLVSTGHPGSLIAHLSCFDRSGDQVFYVPLKDTSTHLGGSYPWRIDGDFHSVIHIRNTTDENARFTIQLDWQGGSYTLPLQTLAPQQGTAIDIG